MTQIEKFASYLRHSGAVCVILRHSNLLHNRRDFAGWGHFDDAMTQMTQTSPYIFS